MATDRLTSRDIVEICFKDVKNSWKQLFLKDEECKKALTGCLEKIKENYDNDETFLDNLCPPLENVLEAFKYFEVDEMRVAIIGQDPYYKKGVANGLCFSHNINNECKRIQPSLKWIYEAIINSKYMAKQPENGDLFPWVKQGVLMLNRYLTTIVGKAGQHRFWGAFTDEVIKLISREANRTIFMLWGNVAQELEKYIDGENHYVLKYVHPSPLARHSVKFEFCPHFTEANKILNSMGVKEINWRITDGNDTIENALNDILFSEESTVVITKEVITKETVKEPEPEDKPEEEPEIIEINNFVAFTDGSAIRNGKPSCEAGCAFVILQKLTDTEYKILHEYKENVKNIISETPTSANSELLGVLKCLESFLENHITENHQELVVYCDNSYTVNTIEKWADKWIKQGSLESKKNPDIVKKLIEARDKIRNNNTTLSVIHMGSHKKEPEKNTEEWCKWYYNDIVDKLAKSTY